MSQKKLSKEERKLQELFLGEYLGLGDISKLEVNNPFKNRTKEDIENPHLHLLRLMRNPDYFGFTCKKLLNIELAPFQIVILKELWKRKYPMLIASRGASKSFTLAIYAILRAVFQQGCKIIIVGAAFRQAKVIFEYIESIWHNAPALRDLVGTSGRSGPKRDIDRCTCILGDSIIIALPLGDGTKIRGQRANYIIADEFASIPRDIYENVVSGFAAVSSSPVESMKNAAQIRVLKTIGMWKDEQEEDDGYGNQAILSGTAYYAFNHFADYWKQYKSFIYAQNDKHKLEEIFHGDIPPKFNSNDFCIIRMPVELLPQGFMDEKHVARSKATVHSGIYNMEFGACFATDSNGFFKRSLIESCVTRNEIDLPISGRVKFHASLKGHPRKDYIFGVDPASEQDNFSIVVLEQNADHRKIVYCWTTTRQSHKEKIKDGLVPEGDFYGYCARKIRDLMKDFPCIHIAMDSQGGGIAVAEALNDQSNMKAGEQPIWPVVEEDDEKETDGYEGKHILELVNFVDADYTRKANHGMRKDFEDRCLLFPFFDPLSQEFALQEDQRFGRKYDTLEDAVMEIEQLKDELAIIEMRPAGTSGRDKWDTPEVKLPGSKKGRLRKDRYSALLMANMAGRVIERTRAQPEYKPVGTIAGRHNKDVKGALYDGPAWFTNAVAANKNAWGHVVKRSGV